MGLCGAKDIELRFGGYVDGLVSVIGHADRAGPLRDYCTGLIMPCERKSVEPMAAITAPGRTAAQHQSLLHFVGQGGWSDAQVLGKVREMVLPRIERHGPIEAWIIDDTSFPKQGRHSVGVSHQYCGQLGKQANCQTAVPLSLANHDASLPVAYRLYLPKTWAEDDVRRGKTGVPEEITFKTKPEIALDKIRWACEACLPGSMPLVDAGYGHDSKLRNGITELGKGRQHARGYLPQSRGAGRSRECRLRQGFQRRLEAACRSALHRTAGRLSRRFQRVDRWIGKAWRHSRHQAPMGCLPWHGAGSATAPPRYPDNRSGRRRNEHGRRVDGTTGMGTRLCRRSCRRCHERLVRPNARLCYRQHLSKDQPGRQKC